MVPLIEKALRTSALKLNPQSEGQELVVPVPRCLLPATPRPRHVPVHEPHNVYAAHRPRHVPAAHKPCHVPAAQVCLLPGPAWAH